MMPNCRCLRLAPELSKQRLPRVAQLQVVAPLDRQWVWERSGHLLQGLGVAQHLAERLRDLEQHQLTVRTTAWHAGAILVAPIKSAPCRSELQLLPIKPTYRTC